MVRCNNVIKHAKTKTLLRFEKPMKVTAPITCKPKEKFSLMAAVCNMPDIAGQEVTVCSRQRFFLELHFQAQKEASKLLNDALYCMFNC